jgi:dTDP-4-dehydrorhamnose reductase
MYGPSLTGARDGLATALADAWRSGGVVERATNVVRTFIHVEDAAAALAELADLERGGTLHLGPKAPASSFAFALAIAHRLAVPPALVRPVRVSDMDAERRGVRLDTALDTSRAREELSTAFRSLGGRGESSPPGRTARW